MRARGVSELVLALAAGAVTGVLGGYAQQQVVGAGRLPVGVALGVALVVSVTVLVRASSTAPWVVLPLALGWFAAVLAMASPRPEGDLVVPGDGRGWAFLLLGTAVLAVALVDSVARRRPGAAVP